MTEHYPLPAHAAYVWLKGDTLMLSFPPTAGHDRGHTVALYADAHGMKVALSILKARRDESQLTVGTTAAPTQYQCDASAISKHIAAHEVREVTGKAKTPKKSVSDQLLEELGL